MNQAVPKTRRLRLLHGAPALIAGLVSVATLAYSYWRMPDRVSDYQLHLKKARVPEVEELCLLRLLDEGANPYGVFWRLHKLARARGQKVYSTELLKVLAPRNRQGHPKAHLEIAQGLIAEASDDMESLRLARIHCRRAIGPTVPAGRVRAFEAQIAALAGDEDAIDVLAAASSMKHADNRALIQTVDWLLGQSTLNAEQRARLRQIGQTVARRLIGREKAWLAKKRDLKTRLSLVGARQFLGHHEEAVGLLLAMPTPKRHRQKMRVRVRLGRAYIRWAGSLPGDSPQCIELIQKALTACPESREILTAVLALEGHVGKRLRARIDQLVTEKGPMMKFQLGTALLALGRADEAMPHLQRAYEHFGLKQSAFGNNLALAMIGRRRPQPDKALALIDRVLTKHGDPVIHETRGQVLMHLGRHGEAVKVLESTLTKLSDTVDTCRALQRCYEALGQTSIAKSYGERASKEARLRELRNAWQVWGLVKKE